MNRQAKLVISRAFLLYSGLKVTLFNNLSEELKVGSFGLLKLQQPHYTILTRLRRVAYETTI